MLFTSTSSCSVDGKWEAVEKSILNHLIVSLPTDAEEVNGATCDGSLIILPNDIPHTHTVPATTLDIISFE